MPLLAILPAQKKNSDFLWLTETSVLSQPRGRLPSVCLFSPGTLPVPKIPEKTDPLISAEGCVQITGLTTGKLIDFGLKDSLNMGGCMAPAACDTIYRNFCDFDRTPDDYDAIFTGDLGAVGKRILLDLLKEKGYDIESIYQDCGLLIFDGETQDTHSGGSGCGCSASVLAAYILPELAKGTWKKVLFVPTGALLSKTVLMREIPFTGLHML